MVTASILNMDGYYLPTDFSKILHAVPHLTFRFILLEDPKFTLDDAAYLESLAMIALMPAVVLLLTMIGFLIYFCCVGVKRAAPNKHNSSACYCSICLMIVFIMITLGGISVSVYGSIQVHEGIASASSSTSEINKSFSTITVEIKEIKDLLYELESETEELMTAVQNSTNVEKLSISVQSLSDYVQDLPNQDLGANDRLEWTIHFFQETEKYRTIITFSLIGCQGLVCLFALLGISCRSKCLLITTTFIGLVCLVASYLYIGSFFMIDVALGDFCMDPYDYILDQAVEKLYMDNDTAYYYLTCPRDHSIPDPYVSVLSEVEGIIKNISNGILNIGNENVPDEAELILDSLFQTSEKFSDALNSLSGCLDCMEVHKALKKFVPAVCISTLEGLFILIVSILCVCFAITALLCAAPKTWKRFTKASGREDLDLDDVFLPPATSRPAVSRTNNPLYVASDSRFSRRVSSNTNQPVATNTMSFFRRSDEDLTLLEPPPPEYSPPRPGTEY